MSYFLANPWFLHEFEIDVSLPVNNPEITRTILILIKAIKTFVIICHSTLPDDQSF